jgi:hypothetical protein
LIKLSASSGIGKFASQFQRPFVPALASIPKAELIVNGTGSGSFRVQVEFTCNLDWIHQYQI